MTYASSCLIRLQGIRKSFSEGQVEVLRGIELSIPPKSLCTLMGPSGSGKSTLLHVLSAIEKPDQGSLAIEGKVLDFSKERHITSYRRNSIGIVFQFFHLLPYLNALENTALPLYLKGISKKEALERALQALNTVGLYHRKEHKPKEMSGGEQQRVAIARSFVHAPRIIFADEPTGNLDSKTSDQVLDLFEQLVLKEGYAIFMVTHNPEIAKRANHSFVMKDGQIR